MYGSEMTGMTSGEVSVAGNANACAGQGWQRDSDKRKSSQG